MGHRRRMDWGRALGSIRQGLPERPEIREEICRAGDGMVAWRGASGRRYVFKRFEVERSPSPPWAGVVAAVRREDGRPVLVAVAAGMDAESFEDWRRDARDGEATEIQVHSIAADREEAYGIVEDLGFDPSPPRSCGMGF